MSTSQSASLKEKTCSETTQNSTRSSFALTRPIFKVPKHLQFESPFLFLTNTTIIVNITLFTSIIATALTKSKTWNRFPCHGTIFAVLSAALETLHSRILPDYVWPCELCLRSFQIPAPPPKAASKVYIHF